MSGKGALFSGAFVAAVIGPAPGAIESNLLGDAAVVGATDVAARSRSAAVDERVAATLLAGPAGRVQFAARATGSPRGATAAASPRSATAARAATIVPFTSERVFAFAAVAPVEPAATPVLLAQDMFANGPDGGGGGSRRAGAPAPLLPEPDARLQTYLAGEPTMLWGRFSLGGGGGGFGPRAQRRRTAETDFAPFAFDGPELALFASPAVAAPAPAAFALFGLGVLALARRRRA